MFTVYVLRTNLDLLIDVIHLSLSDRLSAMNICCFSESVLMKKPP